MSRQLTPIEGTVLQQDTDYLNAGIPVFGSRVLIWTQNNNMPVLIYHTKDYGYVLTDISDLGQSTIDALAKQSEVHDMWYYLTQSTQEVIAERAEQIAETAAAAGNVTADILAAISKTVGNVIGNLIQPLIIPLVIIGVILGIYLIKKG
jgi:hypothetical protein